MEFFCARADHPDTRRFIVIMTIITPTAFYPVIMASRKPKISSYAWEMA